MFKLSFDNGRYVIFQKKEENNWSDNLPEVGYLQTNK